MNRDVVSYGHVVAQRDGGFLIERVQHCAILDVAMLADGDGVHVAAQHGVEPQTRSLAYRHIADNRGVLRHKHVVGNARGEDLTVPIDCLY